jgi:DNA-binding NarL/FixJ family response regulator
METLERGRDHFGQRRWSTAFADLSSADATTPLEGADLQRLAMAGYLVGHNDDATAAWARAHAAHRQADDSLGAVRCAFWLWFAHLNRGEMAQANGWLTRARDVLVEGGNPDGVEQGYLRMPEAVMAMFSGDPQTAETAFGDVIEIADRFADADLKVFGCLGRGQCLIYLGEPGAGLGLLDEVMISVTTDAVSPAIAGFAYCAVIDACRDLFDVRRAQEWTVALTRWCDAQPDLVPYRGQCLVHRAELMQLHGAWTDALAEAEHAEQWLSKPPPEPSVGAACYQRAELLRLQGDLTNAEAAYRDASAWGHAVQPGLALLRLAEHKPGAAQASITVALDEATDPPSRARLLPAYVDIMLAAGDVTAARQAADELTTLADALDAPLLKASSAQADGAVLLAESDPRRALTALRAAWQLWREIDVPYEGACVRELLASAYSMLGDHDSAEMELDAARSTFHQLGAEVDLARIDASERNEQAVDKPAFTGHGLTGREIEVLAQLATGKTNRAIAGELVISEKTVARHVANIFTKLGLSSRSAATAYAYEHGLVEPNQP